MRKIVDIRADVAKQVFAGSTEILPICKYLKDVVKEYHPNQKSSVFIEGVDDKKWYKTNGMKLEHPCVGMLQDANWWRKTKVVVEKVIPTDVELLNLFGINDSNLKYLKKILIY